MFSVTQILNCQWEGDWWTINSKNNVVWKEVTIV